MREVSLAMALAITGVLASAPAARAAVVYWDGSSSDFWSTVANWNTQANGGGGSTSPANNDLIFFATGAQRLTTNTVDANLAINSLTFSNGTGTVVINADASQHVLTLNGVNGVTVQDGFDVSIYAPLALGASQTWTNNSTAQMYIYGNIMLGANTLTYSGSGDAQFNGNITGTGGLIKSGLDNAELLLGGNNSFTGPLAINTGGLDVESIASLGDGRSITLGVPGQGGFIGLRYDGGGGTIAQDIYAYSNVANTVWNHGNGALTFTGTLHTDGVDFTLRDGIINVVGPIVGTGGGNSGLRDYGSYLTLSNAHNTYDGQTYIFGGGTIVSGVNNALPTTTILNIGDNNDTGTFRLNGHTQQVSGLVLDGTNGATLVVNLTSAGVIDTLNTPSIMAFNANRTLEVDLIGGPLTFTPGESFQIFTNPASWADAGTAFTNFVLPAGYQWDTSKLGVNGSIIAVASVPEPGPMLLGLVALVPAAFLGARRRTRKQVA